MKYSVKMINNLLSFIGIKIVKAEKRRDEPAFHFDIKDNLGYDMENIAQPLIKIVRKNTMLPYENLLMLFEQVHYCEINNIKGDYVECGVWKGGAIGLMGLTNLRYSSIRKHLHLFDIFDDICEPDPFLDGKDTVEEIRKLSGTRGEFAGRLVPVKGVYTDFGGPGSLEENKKLFESVIQYDKNYVHYYQGWFQDTLPKYADRLKEIAILRLDGDFYASTKICLEYLYDKVVPGGIIIVDDYGAYEGCKSAVDEFRQNRGIHTFLHYSFRACRYWIKEHV